MKKLPSIFYMILVLGIVFLYAGDDYAKLNGWGFRNWKVDSLSWDMYEQVFIGVNLKDPQDWAWYEFYCKNADGGQCFGMSLLSVVILKEEGHLGFCKPVYTYPGDNISPYTGPEDSLLRKAIMLMHGHQLGHACIKWLLQSWEAGTYKDAKFAYDQVKYYLAMNDPPIISILKSSGKGHAMVPYRCEKKGSSEWRIYVYDPNRPYQSNSGYYDGDSNYIKIEALSSGLGYKWSFKRDWGEVWSGGTTKKVFEGGILVTPSSLIKPSSRNPLKLGAALGDIGSLLLTSDVGSIAQITDEKGRRFYKTDAESHTKLSEKEDDPNLGMTNAIRWIYFGEAKDDYPEAYLIEGYSGGDLKIDVASKGKEYKLQFAGKDNLVKVKAMTGAMGRDKLKLQRLGTNNQELTISSQRGAVTFSVELYRTLPTIEAARTFKVSNLKVTTASPVQLRLTEDLDALLIKSEKGPVTCDLEIVQTVGTDITKLDKKKINISPLEWQKVSPTNWVDLKDANVEVRKAEFKKVPYLKEQ